MKKQAVRKKDRTSNYFTLIELLVIISIIMILMSILFPALKKAKMQGQKISCINTERQIYQLICSYSLDKDGYMPMDHPMGQTADHLKSLWNGFAYDLRDYVKVDASGSPVMEDYFNCPVLAARNPKIRSDANHYGWNFYYMGDNGINQRSPRRRMAGIRRPSTCILVGERQDGSGNLNQQWRMIIWHEYMYRHAKLSNFIWGDGHVSSESYKTFFVPFGNHAVAAYADTMKYWNDKKK